MRSRRFRIVHEDVVTPYPTMPVTRPRWYCLWARHHAALKIPVIMHSYQLAVESLRIEFVEGGHLTQLSGDSSSVQPMTVFNSESCCQLFGSNVFPHPRPPALCVAFEK